MNFREKLQLAILVGITAAIASIVLRFILDPLGKKLGIDGSSLPYLINIFVLQVIIIMAYIKSDCLHPVQTWVRKTISIVSMILMILSVTILTMGYGTFLIGVKWKIILGTIIVGCYVLNEFYYLYVFNKKNSVKG